MTEAASDAAATIDLLGLNIFEACSPTAWKSLHAELRDQPIPIPVVISEAGCRSSDDGARNFTDVETVLRQEMSDVFSGVSVFEWAMREGEAPYGVVKYGQGGKGEPEVLEQFEVLSRVYGAVGATGTKRGEYTPSVTAPVCPTVDEGVGWLVDGGQVLPTIQGLEIGSVTAKTTGTAGAGGSRETGSAGQGSVQGGGSGADGRDGGGLPTGAIAGIVVGCVAGAIVLVAAVFWCLRRRRRAAAPEAHELEAEQPPSYSYPKDKFELPEHPMDAAEMDGWPHSPASSSTSIVWKLPIQGAGNDLPAMPELPDRIWKQTKYELEGDHMYPVEISSARTRTGAWQASPSTEDDEKVLIGGNSREKT
jgi:hypothetical protein